MTPPAIIADLLERFQRNRDAYRAPAYNETQLRREFLDPFFEALGWDVANKQGYAEAYKDVVHEDALKVGGATRAPDYGFRIGGTRKFFVEAKKPAIHVREDRDAAYQLRRYAWSAKLPLSILTNFEEFAVYDCRIKPAQFDWAATARTLFIPCDEYLARWEEIESVFSREAVLKGAFDRYAEDKRARRGTAGVDAAFLAEMDAWRTDLANHLAHVNPDLSTPDLNFAVQRTLDRILFLRICEDRGVETYGRLLALTNGSQVYPRLVALFRDADNRYNSGLFHFSHERGRAEAPDTLTPALRLSDPHLKKIILSLYYPQSPYEFSVLPADILGQVYEQFLGKVIVRKSRISAVVEEKPEVKKAGGVYYTPTYIVDYIVRQTVGRLLEGKTPEQADALRILDPACGSGSFLIAAYQCLLDWRLSWFVANDPEKWAAQKAPPIYQVASQSKIENRKSEIAWRLTTAEKKRVLTRCIYGVDIDAQAVEVTQLSLLLKVLEGETEESIRLAVRDRERALPDIGPNIRCGNSLIAPDFFAASSAPPAPEEYARVNPFDWHREFAGIMQAGGFDAVIGNPPYGAQIDREAAGYLQAQFQTTTKDMDTYSLFMEQAIRLSRTSGSISMIVPTGWYSGSKFSILRRFIACSTDPVSFVNLPYDVFNAWVDTTVFVVTKRTDMIAWPRTEVCKVALRTFPKRHRITASTEFENNWQSTDMVDWFADGSDEYLTYADVTTTRLINKMRSVGKPFEEFADIQRGVTPFALTEEPSHDTCRRAFAGAVRRYRIEPGPSRYIRFDETLAEPKPERYFEGPRLLLRELISRQFQLQAVKVNEDFVTNKSMQSILQRPSGVDLNYLLGILNSVLMSWYFLHRSNIAQRDDFPKIVLKETRSLPIVPVDLESNHDRARHDEIVALVERMLDLHRRLAAARAGHDQELLRHQIEDTDRRIDRLVYALYSLTEDEIRLVEEGAPA
jgi:hypothetical protein